MLWNFSLSANPSTVNFAGLATLAAGAAQAAEGSAFPTAVQTPEAIRIMDNDAFTGFYQRSARPLWAYLARVSGDPALADDLMQETYIRFLGADHAPSLADGEVASRRYLFRIATNLLRDHWRRPRPTSINDLPETLFQAPGNEAQQESLAQLTPALARMNPRERQLLWLAHAEGYSHREIAEITGLASASIRLLLFRARRRIAQLLRNPATPQPRVEPESIASLRRQS